MIFAWTVGGAGAVAQAPRSAAAATMHSVDRRERRGLDDRGMAVLWGRSATPRSRYDGSRCSR